MLAHAARLLAMITVSAIAAPEPADIAQSAPDTQLAFLRIETQCSGGVAGRFIRHELYPDGRVRKAEGFGGEWRDAGRMTEGDAALLSQRLDAIGFDSLILPRRARPVPDSISCSIARTRAGGRHIVIVQYPGTLPAPELATIGEVRRAIEAVTTYRGD